jgi:type II secretory pathway pseudopilin PulG
MKKFSKKSQRGYTLVELVITICGLFSLALVGLLVYVALHFIMKLW